MGVISKFSTAMPESLNNGDLIEIKKKGGYFHWAVYIGGGMVIHLTCPQENSSGCEEKGEVEGGKLTDVIGDSTWRVNNSKDKLFKVLPDDEILKNAESMRDRTKRHPDYNLLCYNCEHFASYCRYGIAYSKQAKIGKYILAQAANKIIEYIHEKHGRLTSETIKTSANFDDMISCFKNITEDVQKMTAQIPCFNGVQASVSCASTVWNRLYLVGLGLKILGCALKQTDTLQELGEKMDDYGNTLMELAADGILVSIARAIDPTLEESEVLKGIEDLANIILHIWIGYYGHALFPLAAAVWPYIPAAIREPVEAALVAAMNRTWTAAKCIYSWLSSVTCSFFFILC